MKRIATFLFVATLIFSMCACSADNSDVQVPADFYYCTATVSYDSETGVISSEVRETESLNNDLISIVNLYLQGPQSNLLRSPFPDGSCVEQMNRIGTEITLMVNRPFAQLSGIDLTLACACLSKTLFGLTDAQTLTIHTDNGNLNGVGRITLSRDSLILLDENIVQAP